MLYAKLCLWPISTHAQRLVVRRQENREGKGALPWQSIPAILELANNLERSPESSVQMEALLDAAIGRSGRVRISVNAVR